MKPHYADDSVTLYAGDCFDVLAELPDNSVDAVVTDPPYGLGFMGREWDSSAALASRPPSADANPRDSTYPRTGKGPTAVAFDGRAFQSWCERWANECLRVLKPGGHMLAFGGSRTWHRLACAIEDAGFEVRDSISWIFGSGFPKSLNLVDENGERTGWGTALKPAHEPIVVARKPLSGTVAANVLEHGTGAINVDGCRVAHRPQQSVNTAGRWPPNVILDGHAADELDQQSGTSQSRIGKPRGAANGDGWGMTATGAEYDDSGGASRFFPTFRYQPKAGSSERPRADDIAHPTVKPLDLMRWLVRLVTPPGGTVLEPFAGSGTTTEACVIEGFKCIAIERDETYLPLIAARLTKPIQVGLDFGDTA